MSVVVLVAAAAVVAGLARRLRWSGPLICMLVGLVASVLPFVPEYRIEPEIVLTLVLPPLLFSAALDSSFVNFRRNLRPIGLLSVGLVIFTTFGVGVALYYAVPQMSFATACVLGAIVAPPDAVASTAIGRRLGLPRRLVVIMAGESLVNDATALTAYRVAVAAAVGSGFSLASAGGIFLLAAVGGVAVGLVAGYAINWASSHLNDGVLENTLLLIAPFLVYELAEVAHTSGVLAVVVAGLRIGHHLPRAGSFGGRLILGSVWKMIDYILESVVFLLIGLQVTSVLGELGKYSTGQLVWWAVLVLVVAIAARFVWVFPGTYLPHRLSKKIAEREPPISWRNISVLSWAGMRGVVSIAAAYGLPEDFPQRDLVSFLTFVVVIGTLVVQGFTLPALIRRLGVGAEAERQADALAEAGAQHAAIAASLQALEAEVADTEDDVPPEVVAQLRERAELRDFAAWERLGGGGTGSPDGETPTVAYKRLRRLMLAEERRIFIDQRDSGRIDDEVLRRVQHELDLEEAMLARE